MIIARPGILGALTVMGAPPEAKPHVLSLEQSKARDAESFIAAFTSFFMEIIEENKRRQ